MIDLIISVILLGFLGVFTTMFLYTGIKGYMVSKQTADGAMRAQIALDRINLELRKVNSVTAATATSITYTNDDLPYTRKIYYDTTDANNHTISIEIDDGSPESWALLDHIDPNTFAISLTDTRDLDNDGNNEIEGINISFNLTDIGRQFTLRVYPRNLIDPPP